MRIIVAHSDSSVRGVLAGTLGAQRLDVDTVESAEAALDAARGGRYDLVLIEAGADAAGIDVCAGLKRELEHFVPIIVLLPEGAPVARGQALAAGADDCIEVPVEIEDLVGRVRSFLRIKALQDQLRGVEGIRGELVEAVSHDLRSPLVGIIGAVQNMLGGYAGPTTPQQREYLMMIGRTASRFHDQMERIQRLARLETRRIDVRAEVLDLEEETRQAVGSVAARMNERRLTLDVEVVGGTPPARGEGALIREALGHLLDNALRFSPSESEIRVRIDEVVEDESFFVRWAVSDQGAGVRRSDQERIFHRFEQVQDAQADAETPGTGLGLAVAKEIVEAHGGRIEVRSTYGKGATFSVLLPAAGERVKS